MGKITQILMERDGMTRDEAHDLLRETTEMLLSSAPGMRTKSWLICSV